MQKILLIYTIFISLFYVLIANSQTQKIRNFEIIDSLIKTESIIFAEEIAKRNITQIEIRFSENPASWLVKQHFYSAFKEKVINILTENNQENSVLNINIKQIEIQYLNYEDNNDSLIRNAKVHIDGNLLLNKKIEIIENQKRNYSDIISRADVDFIKSDNAFANAPVPEKKRTFFEELAVPFIVVTTIILTVVILFTVRSG